MKAFLTGNRMKSFYWRTGMMMLAAIIASISQSLDIFNLPPGAIAILGLLLGEASKAINNAIKEQGSVV